MWAPKRKGSKGKGRGDAGPWIHGKGPWLSAHSPPSSIEKKPFGACEKNLFDEAVLFGYAMFYRKRSRKVASNPGFL